MNYDFDLVTIGAGSGGVASSRYAASAYGKRVAICEEGRVGGTCVLRGCIPKKLFMYAAQFADGFADAAGYGWSVGETTFDLARLTAAKNQETTRLEGIYEKMLASSGVEVVRGRARIVDAHTVAVGDRRMTAERILVATGGSPHHPHIRGIELAITSNEILELKKTPARLLVLGSGYVAVEFASIFRGFGSGVTVAFRAPLPLKGFDHDLRTRLAAAFDTRGIVLRPGFEPVSIERTAGGLLVRSRDGQVEEADVVLNAMGRKPNTADLGLQNVGIAIGAKGEIPVDAQSRTTVPNVFAIGDVTDRIALTPVAIAEGRALVDTEFGNKPRAVDHSKVASGVFSTPPIGSIGLSEEGAASAGHSLRVFESEFRPMKNILAGRPEKTYMKLIADADTDRVLGVHMLGPDAAEILQSIAVAVTMGATKAQFDATMAVHPTAAEEFVLMRTPRAAPVPKK